MIINNVCFKSMPFSSFLQYQTTHQPCLFTHVLHNIMSICFYTSDVDAIMYTFKISRNVWLDKIVSCPLVIRVVMEPAKMQILCAKSIGYGCRFVTLSKLPAIIATAIQLSYLKLNSYKLTSSESVSYTHLTLPTNREV